VTARPLRAARGSDDVEPVRVPELDPALGAVEAEARAEEPIDRIPARMRLVRIVQLVIIPTALLLAWHIVTAELGLFHKALLPPPLAVAKAFVRMVESGELIGHIIASLERIFYANVVALVLGVPLGLAIGLSRTADRLCSVTLSVVRPIPPLAWVPLSILWFGIGATSVVFITFLAAFFAVLLNTVAGARSVDTILLRAAACLGASRTRTVLRVVLPSVLPQIFTGFRIAIGVSWMSIVAAELIAATSGLGYMISFYREVLRTDAIIVGMLTIGLIGLAMDVGTRWLERQLLPWRGEVR
jgi:ABC-type nitrate/sulfonate/bicarbonate transport system permease component